MKQERKVYLLADSHFHHERIIEYCNRPPDYEKRIKNHWKNLITDKDIVIHLGDVIFGSKQQLTNILKKLPGTKILVKGNHDKHSDTWYLDAGFSFVCKAIRMKNVLLTHKPALLHIGETTMNIHGHFHNIPKKNWEPKSVERLTKYHFLLISENIDYVPILLEDAINKKFVVSSRSVE
jgi:calcineurin-like phosphoesterase family protein